MRNLWLLALAIFPIFATSSISQTISGVVTDAATGKPLPNANILILPGSHGAAADANGMYSIAGVPKGSYTIRASFIGYATKEKQIEYGNAPLQIDFALEPQPIPGPRIEVSAMRAKERYSPVSFSTIDQQNITDQYIVKDIPVYLSELPSITYYSESGNGIGYNYIKLRGFDQKRLAIMINGIPQNDPEDHNAYWSNFADLLGSMEEIQVQRGAGSAFYGPPAIGGSVNMITGDFANRKGITLSTGYGSYNTRRFALAGGSGLIDNKYVLYGRLSQLASDGYRDHSYTKKSTYYFAASRYDEQLTTRVNIYGGPIEDGLAYYGLPKFAVKNRDLRKANYNYWESNGSEYTWTSARRKQEKEEFSQPHYELLNELRLNDRVSLYSALFFVRGYGYFDYDGTGWTDASYYRITPEYGYQNAEDPGNPLIHAYVDNRQWGWLPRVTWNHGAGTLTSGLELRFHRSLHYGTLLWAENLPEGYDPGRRYYEYSGAKNVVSAYVQEQYTLSERMNAMASVQYVFNRYRLSDEKFVGTDFSVDYHFVNPRIGLNYNLTQEWNIYWNSGYTQREPRLKNLYDAAESSGGGVPEFEKTAAGAYDFTKPFVKPESLVNIELGAGFTRQTLNATVNLYYMDFTDEIIKNGQVDKFGQPVTGNADKTSHAGIEIAVRYIPLPELELSANGVVSRSRLTRYSVFDTDDNSQPVETKLDGNRIAGFPEQLANARISWRKYGLTASLSMKYVGEQYTDNFQNEENKVDAFTVADAMIGYRIAGVFGLRALDIRCAVYNLFDSLYAASGEGDQFFVGAERNYMIDFSLEL